MRFIIFEIFKHKFGILLTTLYFCLFAHAMPLNASDLGKAFNLKKLGHPVIASDWMVVAANPYAVKAGANILSKGGSAVDAMIAVQTVLGLVEPQSSGLGGGAFLLWFDRESGNLITLDGRETASRHVTPQLFQDKTGKPMRFYEAVIGGKSVGVPGVPALMLEAHKRWGRLEWSGLFDEGIRLAQEGFIISPRLSMLVHRDLKRLESFDRTASYFIPDGHPLQTGDVLKNPSYAQTLKSLAFNRVQSFYRGEIAEDIVATIKSAKSNPGLLDKIDLKNYTVKERFPVCIEYHNHEVCGMGPPSSGGLTVGQILGMLENFNLQDLNRHSSLPWHLIGEASKLAFADRDKYMADSDFQPVSVNGLIDKSYLQTRSALISKHKVLSLDSFDAGYPPFLSSNFYADDNSLELPSTSHISIVDQYGNALSMTTTIENLFGSRLMTKGGFLLNNEMTDFSFRPELGGAPVLNRVEPGKRPRSSMAPTIVLKDGEPLLIIGSPGGSRIISYVVQAIVASIDWQMDIQQVVAMPHLLNRYGTFEVEKGTAAERQIDQLSILGHHTKSRPLNSGLHGIAITGEVLEGGADPRREGIALGN